jgi:molybdenum cofactor synthesis domain-containing protein
MDLRARVLVLSDAAATSERHDSSGPAVRDFLAQRGWAVLEVEILPDDPEAIQSKLKAWADADGCDAIFTTGGTGLGPRDYTPEATRAVLEREAPGLAELMRAQGAQRTPRAALSRGVAGARGKTLIVNLPGSPRGAIESLASIADLLPHAVDLMRGRTEHPIAD